VPQPTPLKKNPFFVFGPPIAMALIGIILILQSLFGSPRPDPVPEQSLGLTVAKLYSENGMKTLEEFWVRSAAPGYLPEIAESTSN
jgi:hypothetical protein